MFIERNFDGNYASYIWIDKNIHTLLDLMWDFMRWPKIAHVRLERLWNVLNHHGANRLDGLQCQVLISRTAAPPQQHVPLKKSGSFWSGGTMAPWTQWWKRSPKKVGVSFLLGLLGSRADLDLQLEAINLRPLEVWRFGGLEGWRKSDVFSGDLPFGVVAVGKKHLHKLNPSARVAWAKRFTS